MHVIHTSHIHTGIISKNVVRLRTERCYYLRYEPPLLDQILMDYREPVLEEPLPEVPLPGSRLQYVFSERACVLHVDAHYISYEHAAHSRYHYCIRFAALQYGYTVAHSEIRTLSVCTQHVEIIRAFHQRRPADVSHYHRRRYVVFYQIYRQKTMVCADISHGFAFIYPVCYFLQSYT